MTLPDRCPECGTALASEARRGICPRCAILRALTEPPPEPEADGEASGRSIHLLLPDGTTTIPPLRVFGDYELIEQIGEGGMGVIFKARQQSLGRIVALKLIRAGSLARPGDIARFQTEAAAAARLQHHHIVAIYEVGACEGRRFYTMEFVAGRSVAQELRAGPLAPREAARLLRLVAEAIHFAHQRGVLHRDLKPANILLDVDRVPRVADFGLAKMLQGNSELTVSGAVIGSPQYMPPEQARGRSAEASPQSDVYSLGAILYESLTGRPPFNAPTPLETMQLVVEQEPIAPHALNPALPPDLETICLKCLAKEPSARYATAQALADELGRFLAGEPIHARPVGLVERGWRWCRRKPALAALGFVLALAPAVIIALLLVMGHQVAGERNRAVAQEKIIRQNLYAEDIALAAQALDNGDFATAWRSLADQIPPASTTAPDLRGFEWRWLWQRAQGDADCTLAAHFSYVNTIAWSPDGRLVASTGADGTAKLWDAATHDLRRTFQLIHDTPVRMDYSDQLADVPHLHPGTSACFSGDGASLLAGQGRELSRLEIASGREPWTLATKSLSFALCCPACKKLAVVRPQYPRTGMAYVSLPAGQVTFLYTNGRSDAVCLSADGCLVARWDRERHRVWLHRVPDGEILSSFDPGRIYVIDMAFTPDGRTLALGDFKTGGVELFDVAAGTRLGELPGDTGRIWALAISPDGRWLATGGDDQMIHLWDLATRREVRQLLGHRTRVNALAFAPDSRHLASGGHDGTVRFWSVAPPPPPPPMTDVFGAFAFTPNGRQLVTQDANGVARLWALPSRQQLGEWPLPPFQSAVFAGHDLLLLADTGSSNQPPGICDVSFTHPSARVRTVPLVGISSPCNAIILSPDGLWAATGHVNGTLAVWDAGTGRLARKQERVFDQDGRAFPVDSLSLSSGGNCLAAATFKMVWLKTWTFPALQPLGDRPFGTAYPITVALSPDGRRVASGGSSQGLRVNIWPADLVVRETEMPGHLDAIVAAAFSPDGRTLATGAADGSLKLWNLAARCDVVTLPLGRQVEARHLAFSPDGAWLGVGDSLGILHLLEAPAQVAARPLGSVTK